MNRTYILFLLFVLLYYNGKTQEFNPRFDHFTAKDGLSNEAILKIFQDSKGFIWVCTYNGVNKFDGYTFSTLNTENSDSLGLGTKYIWDMFEHSDGTLWFATQGGVMIYDPIKEKITGLKEKVWQGDGFLKQEKTFSGDTRSLLLLNSDTLLLGMVYGLKVFNVKTHVQSNFFDATLDNVRIRQMRRSKDDKVWISTYAKGLFIYDLKTQTIQNFQNNPEIKTSISNNNVLCTLEDSRGNIWVGSEGGLDLFNPNTGSFTHYPNDPSLIGSPPKGMLSVIFEDSQQRLWFGFQYGVAYYNYAKGTFTTLSSNPIDPKNISSDEVWCIYEDINKALWFGTFGTGISKLENQKTVFRLFQNNPIDKTTMGENSVLAIHEDQDKGLWVGLDHGGLDFYDYKTHKFTHYLSDPSNSNSISSDAVLSLEIDHLGRLWAGTWGGGLNRLDPATKKITRFTPNVNKTDGIHGTHIWSILEDSQYNIWLATHENGIDLFNTKTEKFKNFRVDYNDSTTVSHNLIWDVLEDKSGVIWVATGMGLNKYLPETGTFQRFFNKGDLLFPVIDLYEDNQGFLWMGTEDDGVIRFNPKTYDYKQFTTKDGLPSNTITSVVQDKHGDFWLGTKNNGLCWFNYKKGVLKNFDEEDGLPGNAANRRASIQLKNGYLATGFIKGFVMFDPKKISTNKHKPPVYITDFQIFNKSVRVGVPNSPLSKHINFTDTIILSHKQSVFSIGFAALDYAVPDKNQYAYIMMGFDKEWNLESDRRATYTNLNPGSYTFRVKASNNDGVWNEEGASLHIIILPPWWMTWWFRTLAILSIIVVTLSYYFYRTNQLRRINLELERQVMQRTQALNLANIDLKDRQGKILQQNDEILMINNSLDLKNQELENKNIYIERQSEQISGSIRYAKNIQQAILPFQELIEQTFDTFIVYIPKDIVSGDFYWFTQEEANSISKRCMVTVADCTGHGVPGAFMSMIGISLLNEIVRVKKIYSPAKVLEKMDEGIRTALNQEKTENNDGMDMALCLCQKQTDNSIQVTFAGAKSSLLIYQAQTKTLERIKGAVKKIGGSKRSRNKTEFENHQFTVQKGDVLYLMSDGLIDQNNPVRKRFGSTRLNELLLAIAELSMEEQNNYILKALDEFKQDAEQRDDITFMGIKIR